MTAQGRVALFMRGLDNSGVPRRIVTLANGLCRRGHAVEIVVLDASGELRGDVDPAIEVVEIGGWRARVPLIRSTQRRQFRVSEAPLLRYLRERRPAAMIAADNYANLTAIAARERSGVPMRLIVSQRTHTTRHVERKPELVRRIVEEYPKADAVVAVSQGVADDLAALGVPRRTIRTIYNPVVDEAAIAAAEKAPCPAHPWFGAAGPPLMVAVGRLEPVKDFPTLLRAFATLRAGRPARLAILGDGKTPAARTRLLELAAELGVADSVALPGSVPDSLPYMSRARLVVLSSLWEGLPGVLVEALACGTPVVSTDCPSGPAEILDRGRYGRLVPVGDAEGLAEAMRATLDAPPDPGLLKARARLFAVDAAVERYAELIWPAASERR